MQQTWRISGSYADWKLTLTVDPPEDDPEQPLEEWPKNRADSIAHSFREMVNCHENVMDLEEQHRRGHRYIAT